MQPNITNNSGIFEIDGSIVTENAMAIKKQLESALDHSDEVIVNLDKVESIDITGVNALAKLYKKAAKKNKALYLIGKENKNLEELFNATKMGFILSRDFV